MAELRAEAARIESEAELDCQIQAREAEISFLREQNDLHVSKAKALGEVEVRTRYFSTCGRVYGHIKRLSSTNCYESVTTALINP